MAGCGPRTSTSSTSVGDPRISPDGRRVAYVVTAVDREANEYRSAIWVAPVDGSAEPRQFTSGERRDAIAALVSRREVARVRLEPRGEDEKKAKGQLYVMPAEGGEPRKLTDAKESVEAIAWSPDSTRIAFARACATPRTRRRTTASARRGASRASSTSSTASAGPATAASTSSSSASTAASERQLTDGDFENDAPAWSPDGKQHRLRRPARRALGRRADQPPLRPRRRRRRRRAAAR